MGTDKLCRHDIDVRSRSAQLGVSPSLRVYTLPRVSWFTNKAIIDSFAHNRAERDSRSNHMRVSGSGLLSSLS